MYEGSPHEMESEAPGPSNEKQALIDRVHVVGLIPPAKRVRRHPSYIYIYIYVCISLSLYIYIYIYALPLEGFLWTCGCACKVLEIFCTCGG